MRILSSVLNFGASVLLLSHVLEAAPSALQAPGCLAASSHRNSMAYPYGRAHLARQPQRLGYQRPIPRHQATDPAAVALCVEPSVKGPIPIQEMKYVLSSDNLTRYFDMEPLIDSSMQAQLPALIAELSKERIWKSEVEEKQEKQADRHYEFWSERHENQRVGYEFPVLANPSTYKYSKQFVNALQSSEKVSSLLLDLAKPGTKPETFLSVYSPVKHLWGFEKHAFAAFSAILRWPNRYNCTKPPTIIEIAQALEIENTMARHAALDKLEQVIDKVVQEDVFILDDIMGTANFMFLLVWRFFDQDERSQLFINKLFSQGAPISERNIFQNYYDFRESPHYTGKTNDLKKYRKIARRLAVYASGSPKTSLYRVMRTYPWKNLETPKDLKMSTILEAYAQIYPDLDFIDPLIIRSLVHYGSFLNDLDTGHAEQLKTIEFFTSKGFTEEILNNVFNSVTKIHYTPKDEMLGRTQEGIAGTYQALSILKTKNEPVVDSTEQSSE